jgi:membrane-associated phospholipid phosphatase
VLSPLNGLVLLALWRDRRRLALLAPSLTLVATLLGAVTTRPRPGLSGYGFPSGHVIAAVAWYGALAYLGWVLLERALWGWLAWGAAVLAILGVGHSRLFLNAHWLTDVLGALAGGGAVLLIAVAWVDQGPPRPSRTVLRSEDRPHEAG